MYLHAFLIVANLLDELALHALRILDVPVGGVGVLNHELVS